MAGDRIAGFRSKSGSLISIYASRPSPGGFPALLSELTRSVRDRSADLDRSAEKSARNDCERIRALADRFEAEVAPAYAVFASEQDGLFEVQPLGHPTADVSMLGPRPYMRPLRAAPRLMRGALLIADRQNARLFVSRDGFVEELGGGFEADIGSRRFGGFAGYEEQSVRARADEAAARLWREAGDMLLAAHMDRRFDYLAVGCHEPDADEIAGNLHPYLSRLQRVVFSATPQKVSAQSLRAKVMSIEGDLRHARQSALAGRVCDTGWSGGNAVLGLAAVLEAANTQAIDTLVVAGPFSRPGSLCDECGHLSRTGESCPVCGHQMFDVDDIVAAAMDATVAAGGNVSQIEVATPLDVEGVGALTRFPVGV